MSLGGFGSPAAAAGVLIPRETTGSEESPVPSDARESGLPIAALDVLERLSSGIAVVDSDLTIRWHNQALAVLCEGPASAKAPAHGPWQEVPPVSLVGRGIYQALRCEEIEGPEFCPFTDCLGGNSHACTTVRLRNGRHIEVTVQGIGSPEGPLQLLCLLRDVSAEVQERRKLLAIHRAGLELSNLAPDELARMSTAERIDLLKANILQYSQTILNFKDLEIRLLEPATNTLRVLLAEGMTTEAEDRVLRAEPTGNGVTGFVAATGTTYVCDDCEHDPHYIPGAPDARSSLTVPILYRERVIGTFNVESPKPRNFTERDAEFLEVFAREIGMALHTLDLLQAEKRYGSTASFEAIMRQVSLPVDAIVADATRMLDYFQQSGMTLEPAQELVRRVLRSARTIKTSIRAVGSELAQQPSASMAAWSERLSGRRVLVVDNDPAVRRSAHWLLGAVGCEIDTAADGSEAMSLVRTLQYDAVVGDVRLPDMSGYELFQRLRDEVPSTPVVLMTGFGYDASHSLVRARQEGLRAVLYKPFRLDRLCEAIDEALTPLGDQAGPRIPVKEGAERIL